MLSNALPLGFLSSKLIKHPCHKLQTSRCKSSIIQVPSSRHGVHLRQSGNLKSLKIKWCWYVSYLKFSRLSVLPVHPVNKSSGDIAGGL